MPAVITHAFSTRFSSKISKKTSLRPNRKLNIFKTDLWKISGYFYSVGVKRSAPLLKKYIIGDKVLMTLASCPTTVVYTFIYFFKLAASDFSY